jgi:hypothetical protein
MAQVHVNIIFFHLVTVWMSLSWAAGILGTKVDTTKKIESNTYRHVAPSL